MEEKEKKKRVRSPNYPFIPLEEAIEFAKILYRNQKQYWVAAEVAAKDWNFRSAKTSYMSQHVAALTAYGLIDIKGEGESKEIKLSDLAFNIIIDERPQSADREKLIIEAALKPAIFRKIHDAYPSELPVEHTLDWELKTKYKFNPDSVKEFLKIFNKTLGYAKVYKSGIMEEQNNATEVPDMINTDKSLVSPPQWSMSPSQSPSLPQSRSTSPSPSPSPSPSAPCVSDLREREIANYPISRNLNARIIISGSSPVTTDSIKKLMALLDLNKEDLHESICDEKTDPAEH